MSQDRSARISQGNSAKMLLDLFQDKNAVMSQGRNAEMFQNSNVTMYPESSATMFPESNAEMYPNSSATMFQDKSVITFQDNNVTMFQDNNVDKYHDRLARMCPVKNAIMSLVNSVNKFQKELKKRFAIASPDKYVTVSLASSARMSPASNVKMFQEKSV